MKVFFLGNEASGVLAYLRERGEDVTFVAADEPFDEEKDEFVVSHGYRRILRPPPVRGINLHISYLPWNRGADPNLWSWIKGTPKGVSIHWIDEGVDTGDVIAQRRVYLPHTHTLASSYEALQDAMLDLFREQWPLICAGKADRWKQPSEGTLHRASDRAAVNRLLRRGWETSVADMFL